MSKITRLKLPKRGEHHNYIIAGDWHSYHVNKNSLDILIKYAKTIPKNNRKLIINGDFIDCDYLMKRGDLFKKWIKRENCIEDFFLLELERETEWANKTLDLLQKTFSEIIFITGNHDWRVDWFGKSGYCPSAYKHHFDLSYQLNLASRGIIKIGYNNWLDIGNVSITHGMYHGSTCLKKHYEACGKSVIFCHVHRAEIKSFVARGETKKAWSLPAMCDLNPEYIKNSETNWSNGFGHLMVKGNGNFQLLVHEVLDNELIVNNKVLR